MERFSLVLPRPFVVVSDIEFLVARLGPTIVLSVVVICGAARASLKEE